MSFGRMSEIAKELEELKKVDLSSMGRLRPTKDVYTISCTNTPKRKLDCLKKINDVLGIGLKNSKEIVDSFPGVIARELTKTQAMKYADEFKKVGMDTLITGKTLSTSSLKKRTNIKMSEVREYWAGLVSAMTSSMPKHKWPEPRELERAFLKQVIQQCRVSITDERGDKLSPTRIMLAMKPDVSKLDPVTYEPI